MLYVTPDVLPNFTSLRIKFKQLITSVKLTIHFSVLELTQEMLATHLYTILNLRHDVDFSYWVMAKNKNLSLISFFFFFWRGISQLDTISALYQSCRKQGVFVVPVHLFLCQADMFSYKWKKKKNQHKIWRVKPLCSLCEVPNLNYGRKGATTTIIFLPKVLSTKQFLHNNFLKGSLIKQLDTKYL